MNGKRPTCDTHFMEAFFFTPSRKARVLVLVCFATVEPNLDLNLDHDRLALKLYRRNLLIDLYRNFKPNLIYERLDCILS